MRIISTKKLIGGVLAVFLLIIQGDREKKYTDTYKVNNSANTYFSKKAGITGADIDKKMLAAIEAKEHNIRFDPVNKTYRSPNRRHNIRSSFRPGSWSLQNRIQQNNPGFKLKFITEGIYADGNCIARPGQKVSVVTDNNKVDFEHEKFTEQYINNDEGVRQNFIIKSAPKNTGTIAVRLQYSGMTATEIAENAISFHNANSTLTYTDIRVWDATGKNVTAKMKLNGNEINLIAEVKNAIFPVTIDPVISNLKLPDAILSGTASYPHIGYDVAGAGDINGDGYGDVLAGSDGGMVLVYYGGAEGITSFNTDTLTDENSSLGFYVAAAGDIDADGYSDFVVGIAFQDKAVVFYGSASGVNVSKVDTLVGAVNSGIGHFKAISGDINGDGYSDIVTGAFFYPDGNGTNGAAFIYYGAASGINTSPSSAVELKLNDPELAYSTILAEAGDINNDGYDDFMIGIPGLNKDQPEEGIALLFYGAASGIIAAPDTIEGNQEGARLGAGMAGGCDLNGDGFSDIIIGAPGYDNGAVDEGIALVYYGAASGLDQSTADTLQNNKPGENFGTYVVCNKRATNSAYVSISAGSPGNTGSLLTIATVYSGTTTGINKSNADTIKLHSIYATNDRYPIAFSEKTNEDNLTDLVLGSIYGNIHGYAGAIFVYYGELSSGGTLPALHAGNQADALYGAGISGAGDVNGDGYSDLIVGAPGYDNGEADEGAAFLYYGSSTGIGSDPVMLEADQANAHFGTAVSGAGDLNDDGYADIIIAAPHYDNGQTDEGVVFVYMGSSTGISTTPAALLESNQANTLFGNSISRAGDVNGDGFSDILIGAPLYDNGQTDEGVVFVYTGSSAGINNTPAIILERDQGNAQFGASVAAAADINADGYSDIVIGAPFYDNGETDEGAAFIYQGSAVGLSNTVVAVIESNQANAQMGISVSGAGDVNGDGYSDVIIAAPYFDNGETDEGVVWVYHGSATGIVTPYAILLEGNQINAQFGYSVAGAGDNNADGYSDIVIGAPYFDKEETDEGAAFVYYGAASGINNAPVAILGSDQAGAHYGTWVNSSGDINGDGYSDVVIGVPQYENGETNEGAIFFYNGSGSTTGTTAAYTFNIAGTRISGAGDLNGDGFDDLIVGVPNGGMYIYYGSQNGISNTPDVTLLSGWGGATAGDVNGDGYGDMVVNIIITQTPQEQISGVVIFYGSAIGININNTDTLEGYNDVNLAPYPSMFGYVNVAGDVNGDGFSDLFIAAPGVFSGTGIIHVYYGSATGIIKTPGTLLYGASVKTYFGDNLIMPGDINGDGYCDVAVGDSDASTNGFQNGAFMVYYGSSAGFIPNGEGFTNPGDIVSGVFEEEHFGTISPAGDVNGDGFADIKVYQVGGGWFIYPGSAAGISRSPVYYPTVTAGGIADVDGDGYADTYINGTAIGDINGDGFTDIALNAADKAEVYWGNKSAGIRKTIQLFNTSTTIPIQQVNITQPDFAIGLFAKNPQGRTKGKLVWETRAQGQPFSSGSPITNSTQFTAEQMVFSDLGASGILLTDNVNKTAFQTKVRARVKYDPVTSLNGQVYSRWVYPPGFFGAMSMNAAALPVDLIDFTATPVDNKRVRLFWETASEINNSYFSVERSADAARWHEINKVNGAGNASTNIAYEVWDEQPYKGISYYRLKQVDKDGKFSYSEIRKVNIADHKSKLRVYPNPANSILSVEGSRAELTRLQLYNVEGKNITPSIKIRRVDDTILSLDISRLTPGIYYLQTTTETRKIIRQ
ncbi:hypothetical protein DC498_01425 [Terrimonas sp.]|uniref:FG-GAP-like repeat-containing protein n=1 Tax=Terrimonas sp. TaxID=1914338 RepID=UPI000D51E350|nr:FG-GAP-like repeat-containing protein [Terrimonas sp.]PVD54080.1 hypothetical protein DC498_01425 [Terrimonas sp.]